MEIVKVLLHASDLSLIEFARRIGQVEVVNLLGKRASVTQAVTQGDRMNGHWLASRRMISTSSLDAPLPLSSPPSSAPTGSGSSSKDLNKPFNIRAELLAPARLPPKAQLLHYTRSVSIQVIAHEVFLLVLACTKGGNVGTTVVMALLANGYRAERMALSTRQPDRIPRCEALKAPSALPMFQLVPRYYDNARLARESDVLVFCMPPSQLKSVAIQIRHALAANADSPPLVISALCGVTHQSLSKACGSQAVVRVQPDVMKIASLWSGQHEENDNKGEFASDFPNLVQMPSSILSSSDYQQKMADRDQQRLPLRLAAEAIAPQREDVRNLVQALCLFCRRAWTQDMSVVALGKVLFGDKSKTVMVTLGQVLSDINGEHQHQNEETVTPLVLTNWPVEWEQDLIELQKQLAAQALQN
ncbi:Pyrroline-5-carboxylate reductase, catalytic, N-terminal [Phytophthora cactorum]|nr:Pyrroline-5-carboxylate reductase, catalytic, N-terminal [Phytophthora cactorum]